MGRKERNYIMKYPVQISIRDYEKECSKSWMIDFWLTLIGAIVGFIVFSVLMCHKEGRFPLMKLGDMWVSSIWFLILFFVPVTSFALLNILREKKKYYNDKTINAIYEHGNIVEGVYAVAGNADPHDHRLYDEAGTMRRLYVPVPFKYQSLKPLACRAYVRGNMALVYEIMGEVKGYRSSEEYILEQRRKND